MLGEGVGIIAGGKRFAVGASRRPPCDHRAALPHPHPPHTALETLGAGGNSFSKSPGVPMITFPSLGRVGRAGGGGVWRRAVEAGRIGG